MRLLLNLIWLVFGGLVMAAGYALAALVMLILIITIPFGIASARIALFCLWPFGRTIVRRPDAGAGSMVGNVIWFVLAGWWLALGHLYRRPHVSLHHRDPARAGELQADPGLAHPVRARDRRPRPGAPPRHRAALAMPADPSR